MVPINTSSSDSIVAGRCTCDGYRGTMGMPTWPGGSSTRFNFLVQLEMLDLPEAPSVESDGIDSRKEDTLDRSISGKNDGFISYGGGVDSFLPRFGSSLSLISGFVSGSLSFSCRSPMDFEELEELDLPELEPPEALDGDDLSLDADDADDRTDGASFLRLEE